MIIVDVMIISFGFVLRSMAGDLVRADMKAGVVNPRDARLANETPGPALGNLWVSIAGP